jgi:DNA helicase-2/ATP-dependent DNA helicase PcrA
VNRVTLAVAGSRKTQSIVDACATGPADRCRLAITYTTTGQAELERRLRASCRPGAAPEVLGWYAFLLRHCIRPYLPRKYPEQRLRGLNFDGEPVGGRFATGVSRFLDADGRAYKLHLSKLAHDVVLASKGAAIDRLANIYDDVYVDKVQDLTGWDLGILEVLMNASGLDVHMVGDVRQSVFDTNSRDPKFKQYRASRCSTGLQHRGRRVGWSSSRTWRPGVRTRRSRRSPTRSSRPSSRSRPVSRQTVATEHDGVYAVSEHDVEKYLDAYRPQPLRPSVKTAKGTDLPFRNFGAVKGLTFERTLIYPTVPITQFLTAGTPLANQTACGLYVAVTRAVHSVAFVVPDPSATSLRIWRPPATVVS